MTSEHTAIEDPLFWKFVDWASGEGAEFDKLEFVQFTKEGRGALARKPIGVGRRELSCPLCVPMDYTAEKWPHHLGHAMPRYGTDE